MSVRRHHVGPPYGLANRLHTNLPTLVTCIQQQPRNTKPNSKVHALHAQLLEGRDGRSPPRVVVAGHLSVESRLCWCQLVTLCPLVQIDVGAHLVRLEVGASVAARLVVLRVPEQRAPERVREGDCVMHPCYFVCIPKRPSRA